MAISTSSPNCRRASPSVLTPGRRPKTALPPCPSVVICQGRLLFGSTPSCFPAPGNRKGRTRAATMRARMASANFMGAKTKRGTQHCAIEPTRKSHPTIHSRSDKDAKTPGKAGVGFERAGNLEHAELPRQPERKPRPVGDHPQEDEHGEQPRPDRDGQLSNTHLGNPGSHIQIEADRRVTHADFHIHHHQED